MSNAITINPHDLRYLVREAMRVWSKCIASTMPGKAAIWLKRARNG